MTFRCILISSESGCGLDGSKKMTFRSILISSESGSGLDGSTKMTLRCILLSSESSCGLDGSTKIAFRSIRISSACGSSGNMIWSIRSTRRRRGLRRICSMGGKCCICSIWRMCGIRSIRHICIMWTMCAYVTIEFLPRSSRADRFQEQIQPTGHLTVYGTVESVEVDSGL